MARYQSFMTADRSKRLSPYLHAATKATFLLVFLGAALAWASAAGRPNAPDNKDAADSDTAVSKSGENAADRDFSFKPDEDDSKSSRVREGTEFINQTGFFRFTGDRVAFFTNDGRKRYTVLENLNLERIARTILERTDQIEWNVTGTITEFRGTNYLFVRRATLMDRSRSGTLRR